mgnify:CR=1 FL=1
MKEKNTLPSKGKSIFYLMLSLTTTLFVSSFIYFLVLHPSLDNKAVRISINIGWTCFCLYAFKRLTQRYTFWWHALDENPNKSQNKLTYADYSKLRRNDGETKDFARRFSRKDRSDACQPLHTENREGKSHPLLNLRGYLQGTRLSTWRYSRI